MKSLNIFIVIITLLCFTSSHFLIDQNVEFDDKSLAKNPMIYQISTRPWLYSLSKSSGKNIRTLNDIPDSELANLKSKGFDIIWFMGVWQLGEYGVKHDRTDQALLKDFKNNLPDFSIEDAIGSPYAVKDYSCNLEICPNGDEDLLNLKRRLNALEMKLMLDFVPNHSAYETTKDNLDFYIRSPKNKDIDRSKYFENGVAFGNMQWSSSPWSDVAQFNYYNLNLRKYMTENLKKISDFADAIRCDMAYIVLNQNFYNAWKTELDSWGYDKPSKEFWEDSIKEVKIKNPNTIFLAEVYGDQLKYLIEQGFDYVYDKELLDRLKSGHLDNIKGWINYTSSFSKNLCRFIENHDDNRATSFFGFDISKSTTAAVITYTLPGLRFVFQDQWNGYRNKLDVHLRRSYYENVNQENKEFYNKFLPILSHEIFKNGNWEFLNIEGSDSWRLMAWNWKLNDINRLVVVNFAEEKAFGKIKFNIYGSGNVIVKELLSNQNYERSAEEIRNSGLGVLLEKHQAQIFEYK